MHKSYSWNAAVISFLLAATMAMAMGCPASREPSTSKNGPPSVENSPPETGLSTTPAPAETLNEDSSKIASGTSDIPPQVAPESAPPPPTTTKVGAGAPEVHEGFSEPPVESVAAAEVAPGPKAPHQAHFADWPEPKYVFMLTGRQNGYLEPCGCAGLTNQKGGLARRHTLYEQLVEKGWTVLPFDAGNQVRRYGRQAEIKFQVTTEGLKKLNYKAVALGPDDLRLSGGELLSALSDSADWQSPFLCANASLYGLTKSHRIIEAGGEKIGVTAILGSERLKKLQSEEIEKSSAEEGLQKVLPQLEAAGCNVLILLANAEYEESKALAEKFPQFDIIVAAAGAGEPPTSPEKIGDTQLILIGEKSMYAGVLGVFDDPENRFRYERVGLDKALADSPFMLKLLAAYQDALQSEGLEGLGLRPVTHPSGNEFVGSQTCGECHTTAYEIWQNTPHHHALESLVHPGERVEIPRHHDPECISCHVTGWDPQGYFPYKSGYVNLEQSKLLHGNGCENCHGPGSKHVAAEMGELDLEEAEKILLRESMRLPLAQAEKKCLECHDLDNDPNFQKEGAFAEYWEQIKHYGKD